MSPKIADSKVVENALKIKEANARSLLNRPNVTGVDVGFKYIGGNRTEEVAIRIFVQKKQDVSPADAIPSVIEGVKTDVIERSEIVPLVLRIPADAIPSGRAPDHVDTLLGGISIGPCREIDGGYHSGTLGVIVTKGDNDYYALSNFHVLCVDDDWKNGDIAQPSKAYNGTCPYDTIGEAVSGCYGDYITCHGKQIDAAICTITGRGFSNKIKNIGLVEGSAAPMLGASVRKQGRTTGLTYGFIDGLGATNYTDNDILGKRIYFKNAINIRPDTSKNDKFSDHGDSGSAIVDEENQLVGLLYGGGKSDPDVTSASDFHDVELALGITLYTGDLPPGPYFFLYRERDQSGQIYNYYIDGATQIWKDDWKSGEMIIRSFTFEDDYCLFSVKKDGTVTMDRINSNVHGTSEEWRGRWPTGWNIVEPFELEDNAYLVSAKGEGTIKLDQINPGLQGTTELWHGRLKHYITIIKPFIIRGYVFLFEYQPGDGRVSIVQFYPGFTQGITGVWSDKWTLGYTTLQTFYMKDNVYLFEYKSGTGYVAIDRIDTHPFGTTNVWTDTWSTGWTIIEPFYIDDAVYLLEYNERHGTVAFDWINPASMRPTEKYRGTWATELTNIQHCFDVNP